MCPALTDKYPRLGSPKSTSSSFTVLELPEVTDEYDSFGDTGDIRVQCRCGLRTLRHNWQDERSIESSVVRVLILFSLFFRIFPEKGSSGE